MAKPIIEVKNLSKLYHLGQIGATTLRDCMERWWYRVRGKENFAQKFGARKLMILSDDPQAGPGPNTIWALKDILFTVQKGEILGIIGRNGAGKSTLLKILSRITEPTTGKAIIYGRTSSILEIGTGFHPELTGRENVYLNGTIHGMLKAEINRKFDEIVAFAEVEKFIDTPLKRYSSGMYVRLAFAVAAHLEPEVLLLDEVLAVGDSTFQEKCLRYMRKLRDSGVTILFVSHNLHTVQSLCQRVILLEQGKIMMDDLAHKVVAGYYKLMIKIGEQQLRDNSHDLKETALQDTVAWITNVIFMRNGKEATNTINTGDTLSVKISFNTKQKIERPAFTCGFYSLGGAFMSGYSTVMDNLDIPYIDGSGEIILDFPEFTLSPAIYETSVSIADSGGILTYHWLQKYFVLIVEPGKRIQGDFYIPHKWELHCG
jgi:lipopolysaccharide transport system ATP-binding protein